MLDIVHRWVSLYSPESRIVAGGFNFDHALSYLDGFEAPETLRFDEISVQMNLGELSPERADIEGFLDEMNEMLDLRQTGRCVRTTQLDWAVGPYISPTQQAGYHARSTLILDSRGALPHRFPAINPGQRFRGPGIFYRALYGNSDAVQMHRPRYVPKPSFFALHQAKGFLKNWSFARNVVVPDENLRSNRAFIYRNEEGRLAVTLWRALNGPRTYELPDGWQKATAEDAFGFEADIGDGLALNALPLFVYLPENLTEERVAHDLRTLRPDGADPLVLLDLHMDEKDTVRRARYGRTGENTARRRYGRIPGGRKVDETFIEGMETERLEFTAPRAGHALLVRRWYFDGEGVKLQVALNDGEPITWDLTAGERNVEGIRESTFVLRGCREGTNSVKITYGRPGNCAGYRVEPLAGESLPLVRWGVLNAVQTKGELEKFTSATGTPLKIGKTTYESGLGTHAVALIEYPLDGQFSKFEVTVGIDAVTDGRGSAIFEVLVDGQKEAASELMNGFSKPRTLQVDGLKDARRLILLVRDGGDSNQDDVADWVEGKLFLE
jgi:hypothetical protein